jgi:dUTP pyrophosphatase
METKVKVINSSYYQLPEYQTSGSSGMDVHASIPEGSFIILKPLGRSLVPTGLSVVIPEGYEIQVRPRSGLAWKKGITVLNAPGTVDSDFRGEIMVNLVNLSDTDQTIRGGERIAQLVLAKTERIGWDDALELSETGRGAGGHGSTGNG